MTLYKSLIWTLISTLCRLRTTSTTFLQTMIGCLSLQPWCHSWKISTKVQMTPPPPNRPHLLHPSLALSHLTLFVVSLTYFLSRSCSALFYSEVPIFGLVATFFYRDVCYNSNKHPYVRCRLVSFYWGGVFSRTWVYNYLNTCNLIQNLSKQNADIKGVLLFQPISDGWYL